MYVEFGANLEAQDNGQLTALLWAAVNGNEGDWGESCATNWNHFYPSQMLDVFCPQTVNCWGS